MKHYVKMVKYDSTKPQRKHLKNFKQSKTKSLLSKIKAFLILTK